MTGKARWIVTPRDPLVLGDGRPGIPGVAPDAWRLPLPTTTAGMVRSCFVQDRSSVTSKDAEDLLEHVRIRGPWVLEDTDEGPPRHHFPPPSDLLVDGDGRVHAARLIALDRDEGVSWPPGLAPLPLWVSLADKDEKQEKLHPPNQVVWPLEELVYFSLGLTSPGWREPRGPALELESRIHVAIDPDCQTAEPGLLYATTGVRFPERVHLALEVEATLPEGTWGPLPRAVVVGGESRPSFLQVEEGTGLPGLDSLPFFPGDRLEAGTWAEVVALAARGRTRPGDRGDPGAERGPRAGFQVPAGPAEGIRLQLLTPASLDFGNDPEKGKRLAQVPGHQAWLPSWLERGERLAGVHPQLARDGAPDITLELTAVCIPRGFVSVSGWNLQATAKKSEDRDTTGQETSPTGGPREVRRLVPAGSVYYFTVWENGRKLEGPALVDVFQRLWMASLEPEGEVLVDRHRMRAHPARDGFGLVLPGFWRSHRADGKRS